jgi:PAS domain-containing protein
MMSTDFKAVHPDDTLRDIIQTYLDYKLDSLPVVDEDNHLIGVFPKGRLYTALLNNAALDDSCSPYIVNSPVKIQEDLNYDEVSLVMRINKTKVGSVPVVDNFGKVVGFAGRLEYLKATLDLTVASHALLESIFQAMYEGIIVVDNDGKILRMNQSAEKMFGLSFSDVRGLNLATILPEIPISATRLLGVRCKVGSISVIVNQVPIMENNVRAGTNIAVLDVSDAETIAKELEIDSKKKTKAIKNATGFNVEKMEE